MMIQMQTCLENDDFGVSLWGCLCLDYPTGYVKFFDFDIFLFEVDALLALQILHTSIDLFIPVAL